MEKKTLLGRSSACRGQPLIGRFGDSLKAAPQPSLARSNLKGNRPDGEHHHAVQASVSHSAESSRTSGYTLVASVRVDTLNAYTTHTQKKDGGSGNSPVMTSDPQSHND